ncbi:hypothetical protein M404DRAFT_123708 [Pisolithus tinctorius Marx 270]|uniref:DDE Tnp4 domain-containing protein n=1 Tax=Pisolithus tinctorius Marx 270 TaxID=870435 RepID=A0A0C3JT46_PISTI|nr:hypothetical protein M404DRAFT_123708 [Pisolithus tinctorius Marx 270]
MSVTGLTIRHVGEWFQHSNATISRYFHKMLIIFSTLLFYTKYIHLPDENKIHTCIQDNTRFWPFFKDAIGALDGSHIHAAPSATDHGTF